MYTDIQINVSNSVFSCDLIVKDCKGKVLMIRCRGDTFTDSQKTHISDCLVSIWPEELKKKEHRRAEDVGNYAAVQLGVFSKYGKRVSDN